MKKSRILFLMLLCSMLFSSCNKEQVDSASLEGTWVAYNVEFLFDGNVVFSGENAMEGFGTITFSEGSVSIMSDGEWQQYPYTLSNGIISMASPYIPIQMKVKEMTKSKLVLDYPIPSIGAGSEGAEHVDTYKGKTIYMGEDSYIFDGSYWYMSGNKAVFCAPIDEDDYSQGWLDTYRMYLKK